MNRSAVPAPLPAKFVVRMVAWLMMVTGGAAGFAHAQTRPPIVGDAAESLITSSAESAHRRCPVETPVPNEADEMFAARNYGRAEEMYRAMLTPRPGLADGPEVEAATAGLVRTLLAEHRLAEALDIALKASAAHPQSVVLEDVLGETRLQRGEVEEAVFALNRAAQIDICNAQVHADMARYLRLMGMFATAQKQLDLAHQLSPNNPSVNRAWTLSHATPPTAEQVVERLHERLNDPGLSAEQKSALNAAIKALEAREKGDCRIERPVEAITLKMAPISNGISAMYAAGLDVELNGHRKRLEIDTGASGLLISKAAAASAGLVAEAEIKTGGIGDSGVANGFVTHVDHLKIGGMEFRNCMVRVLEKASELDVDGLIGPDVFRDYLVTLDTPGREVRLGPLPKRPQDGVTGTTELNTTGDTAGRAEASRVPVDRYMAPEMKGWTQVYRVANQLIFPTRIGNAPLKLFIMDTGAARGLISPDAAREVTRVSETDPDRIHVRGINGNVANVYQADDVEIEFAGVRQLMQAMTSIDTSEVSRWAGVEISGFIGFPTLRELVITIDYRDNLVHVVYDPKHGFHGR